MEQEEAEIAEITFFLAKENMLFDTVFDAEKHAALKKHLTHNFKVDGEECRFIYFESKSERTNPPWLVFANDQLPAAKKIAFNVINHSPNGILLIQIEKRLFVATFGRNAISYLDKKAFEPDFGIKTAMNMCGNEEIRQTKSSSNAITPTQIDRQVSQPVDTFTFGLSEAEDLKYISGHLKGKSNVTLQGKNSLTMKLIGKSKLTWPSLISQCRDFRLNYGKKDYIELFPNYRNFRLAEKHEEDLLDQELIRVIKAGEFDKLRLSIPEFISEDDFGFTYSNHPTKENIYYAYLDTKQLAEALAIDKVTIQSLHSKHIYAYSPINDEIQPNKTWSVYDCLVFEHKLHNKYFILNEGRWSEVAAEFYNSIADFIENVLHEEPFEKPYGGIDISDVKAKKNLEKIFNARVCEIRPSSILFDRAQLKIGNGPKNKEFCDILDLQDNGTIRIINCKPYKGASSINYLFSQAKFYCESFLTDPTFLADIRGHIKKSKSPKKANYPPL